MSKVVCRTCNKVRQAELHKRSSNPPEAAKQWLKKHCQSEKKCDFSYQASIIFQGPVMGQ